ncbi:MAG: hypothetical protein ACRDZP_05725 [Acidimicrobiales bacterium]
MNARITSGAPWTGPGTYPCPDALAAIELSAALHVYRNAAFAYRRLASTSGQPSTATGAGIASSCRSLLAQANHHLAAFRASLAATGPPGP